jgi:hypothetical protein
MRVARCGMGLLGKRRNELLWRQREIHSGNRGGFRKDWLRNSESIAKAGVSIWNDLLTGEKLLRLPWCACKHAHAHALTRTHARTHALPPATPSAGYLDDLYSFDPVTMTWTLLSTAKTNRPPARYCHGFTSAGGRLYLHGGYNGSGDISIAIKCAPLIMATASPMRIATIDAAPPSLLPSLGPGVWYSACVLHASNTLPWPCGVSCLLARCVSHAMHDVRVSPFRVRPFSRLARLIPTLPPTITWRHS